MRVNWILSWKSNFKKYYDKIGKFKLGMNIWRYLGIVFNFYMWQCYCTYVCKVSMSFRDTYWNNILLNYIMFSISFQIIRWWRKVGGSIDEKRFTKSS